MSIFVINECVCFCESGEPGSVREWLSSAQCSKLDNHVNRVNLSTVAPTGTGSEKSASRLLLSCFCIR